MPVIIFDDTYLDVEPPTPEQTFEAYRRIIEEHGSAPALLQLAFSDGETGTILLDGMGDYPQDGVDQVVDWFEQDEHLQGEWPLWGLVCTDSLMAQAETEEALADLQEDETLLPELVELGMPGVSKCVLANMVHRSGHVWFAQQLYREEGGQVIWSDIDVLVNELREDPREGEVDGAVPESLTRLVHHP